MSQAGTYNNSGGGGGGGANRFDADSGFAVPLAGVLNIFGGTNITTTGGGNTIQIDYTGPGTNTWTVIVASQTMVPNNGYIVNGAGTVQLLLPAISTVGSILEITEINNATGWQVTQAAGQQIRFGALTTTLGAGGSLTSSAIGDSIRMVCTVANTNWQVLSAQGNITIV